MAIQNLPAFIGSSAVNETGQRWMSDARPVVNLPRSGWMSEMAGRAKWNILLNVGSNGSGSIVGYSSGAYGGVTNNSGVAITVMSATNRDWDQVNQGIYVGSHSSGFSRAYLTLEGFNGNERIHLPNSGINGVDGSRLYTQNYRTDVYYWLYDRRGWNINGLLEWV